MRPRIIPDTDQAPTNCMAREGLRTQGAEMESLILLKFVCKKNPLAEDKIKRVSKKLVRRTRNKSTKRPQEGTFEIVLCE